jgi:hypothetical protein
MKILRYFVVLSIIFVSCSKDDERLNDSQYIKKSEDPVIAYYSPFGEVEIAPNEYIESLASTCTSPYAIYLYTPNEGPFQGKVCEIYRYLEYDDIESACGDEFDRQKKTSTSNGKTYHHCPFEGSNCQEIDGGDLGCLLVFCDEGDLN